MSTSALAMLIATDLVYASMAVYFFYKVFTAKDRKPST